MHFILTLEQNALRVELNYWASIVLPYNNAIYTYTINQLRFLPINTTSTEQQFKGRVEEIICIHQSLVVRN